MNVRQIEYVLAVSEVLNFEQAAEKCFVSQSTLSTMIGKLEDELGIKIFDRKTKPVTVTLEGSMLIAQMRIIAKEIARLHELTDDLKGALSGELKIGVIPTIAPYLLPHFLTDFVASFPNVLFQINELTTEKIIRSLVQRTLDVGIVSIPLDHPHLIEIPLYDEPFVLYDCIFCGEKTTACHTSEIDLSRLWLLEDGHCLRTQVERLCDLSNRRNHSQRNVEYKSGTIDTLLKFVRANAGVTLLPLLATLDLPPSDHLHIRHFESPTPVRSVGLVVHQHFVKKQLLVRLRAAIQQAISPKIDPQLLAETSVILPL